MTEVRKMRSPQTIGDDQPLPGTSTDQATFFFVSHSIGRSLTCDTPAFGPRNLGQLAFSSARAAGQAMSPKLTRSKNQRSIERPFSIGVRQANSWRIGSASASEMVVPSGPG